jgi:Na+/H+ antiporter NhaD/arsenite permease-like protein
VTPPIVSPLWILPFAALLSLIAIAPLLFHAFWERHYPKIALALGSVVAVYYLFFHADLAASRHAWLHEMQEYASFIALLGSLYIVSGGVVIHVSRRATPATNTALLLVGAVLANLVGTTGAAMLLIRPFIRMNRAHIKPYHVLFFIFIVANCGGLLTPIGDPPLFMGYLKGVPFFWVAQALWPIWVVCLAVLLALFFVVDTLDHKKVERHHDEHAGPGFGVSGGHNFLFIGVVILAVFRPSLFDSLAEGDYALLFFSREVLMIGAAVASRFATKTYIYERNQFSYGPIKEVAILFVGIFSTMVPALNYLNVNSKQMPLDTPGQYYFVAGTLSAVLDNAPTYLVFLETEQGKVQAQYGPEIERLRAHLDDHPPGVVPPPIVGEEEHVTAAYDVLVRYNRKRIAAGAVTDADIRIAMMIGKPDLTLYLIAISAGAVFFGACTYIGNGPNFMVKSIAESSGVPMPSFFGYVLKYTLPILIPTYLLVWLLFFILKLG